MRDDLIEFALGTLSGRSRALVLDHLETCAHCTAESEALADAADTLLWLAPEAEPPLGFETRVIERFRGTGAGRQIDRRRRLSLFAVAALLVVGDGSRYRSRGDARGREPPVGDATTHDRSVGVRRSRLG
jgi:hypothetical protein